NEPNVNNNIYSSCEYPNSKQYVEAYRAVASAIRKHDPKIMLFSDTYHHFPKLIGPAMKDPEVASLVDAYCVHTVGMPSEHVRKVHAEITSKLPPRPWFQNEYEYLTGGATPDRCLNTVQHIMNSFGLADNPTWFWIHALKPLKNAEASGYSLGFWKSLIEKPKAATATATADDYRRWPTGPVFTKLPPHFKAFEMISAKRSNPNAPGLAYSFIVNQPVTIHLLAEDHPDLKLEPSWEKTQQTATWGNSKDLVFTRKFPAGTIKIPAPGGKAAAHLAFVEPSNPATFKPQIGMNLPIEIRSQTIALEEKAASIKPGHWIYNPYNWNAVGSFVKRMPWNCVALNVEEAKYDANGRIFAFKKPNGKVTIVVSNRSSKERTFDIATGLGEDTWKGYRYTPDEAGEGTMGVPVGEKKGSMLKPVLPAQSWEFWEQQ
ncbi:MAG: glycoside hydrolase family 30 beta sandwich domain-containing protein, partial [Luteolibacter sp.]